MGISWFSIGLQALTKLPIERLLSRKRDPVEAVEELEEKLLSSDGRQFSPTAQSSAPVVTDAPKEALALEQPNPSRVTTLETIQYQKRELGKEIMLLEKHLQQKCKIGGKACDCCEKHPIVIEGLAQETLGMTGDKLYESVIAWARKITPKTTEEASRSGEFDNAYPGMAVEARNIRKRIMGTADVKALLSPELNEKVRGEVEVILDRVLKKEGEDNG